MDELVTQKETDIDYLRSSMSCKSFYCHLSEMQNVTASGIFLSLTGLFTFIRNEENIFNPLKPSGKFMSHLL
jgi:hypothetical protein